MEPSSTTLLKFSDLLEANTFPIRNQNVVLFEESYAQNDVIIDHVYKTEFFGLMLVEAGESYYSVGDYRYEIKKNDILFVVPGEVFKVHFVSKDFSAKYLCFNIQMISDAGFNYRSNDIIKSFSTHPSYIIKNERIFYRKLQSAIAELAFLNDARNDVFYANEMIWHLFSLIMYTIEEFFRQSNSKTIATSREETITTNFYLLVQSHYNIHHDVQFYADKLFISRKHLSKVIKKTMGIIPKDIIHQVLLIEAKILLKNRLTTIGSVAELLNFKDPFTFSKFFKKQTGMSPKDYKEEELF
ncbi:AraC family transcriptional regulator [Sphingobacterium sp. UT-1RO-CII-1]|uniref:AraC family transcriptional regulator n=1 Tax=Sphingobacterium sp. UT-1RO-CII-1 TaxID=2995225 RepID=UPI00227BFD4F|nr:AraC family transcriptional regulator [Sphingobacterium sp. UT-1RO-CII-1]MCY4779666.1 AraC family transcriptional regulator [Sphingobacterium sp. UT-1RO-CII-1]